jgi:predicted RNase H-like HicB family nuclease
MMPRKMHTTFSYSVFYEQCAEGGYVAFVPALPGCHTQGETLEETEAAVKEAIALYLESLTAHGEESHSNAKLTALGRAIDDGDASGVADGDVFARIRRTLSLPARPR